ncbi:MAG: YjzC family protein [Christensenellales bacterium]|jgi:hypothetical protein
MKKFKPGELAPKTGRYKACDNKGKVRYTVDIKRGEHLPPVQGDSRNWYFILDESD